MCMFSHRQMYASCSLTELVQHMPSIAAPYFMTGDIQFGCICRASSCIMAVPQVPAHEEKAHRWEP